jgi:hypothetical protein
MTLEERWAGHERSEAQRIRFTKQLFVFRSCVRPPADHTQLPLATKAEATAEQQQQQQAADIVQQQQQGVEGGLSQ